MAESVASMEKTEGNRPIVAISLQPPTPADLLSSTNGKKDKEGASRLHRRLKLDGLRQRMQTEDDDEVVGGMEGVETETSSMSSWGRGLLTQPATVAHAADSQSTRGPLPSAAPSARASPHPPRKSESEAPSTSTAPNPTQAGPTGSSGSSKSGTLENYVTPDSGGPAGTSKSSSLDRGNVGPLSPRWVSPASSLEASRLRSLSRDASLSGTSEAFVLAPEQWAEGGNRRRRELQRKNSEAAELIEALTSQVVGIRREESGLVGKSSSLERPSSLVPGPSGTGGTPLKPLLGQPDVVASAVRSSSGSSLHQAPSASVLASKPVPPPRKTKNGRTVSGDGSEDKRDSGATLGSGEAALMAGALSAAGRANTYSGPSSSAQPVPESVSLASSSRVSSTDSVSTGTCSIASIPQKERTYLNQASFRARHVKKALTKRFGNTVLATKHGMKKVAGEVTSHLGGTILAEEGSSASEEEETDRGATDDTDGTLHVRTVRIRPRHSKKGPFDFEALRHVQDLSGEHTGAVWCLKFSLCGRLLATAGQDNVIRVWVLRDSARTFGDMRLKYDSEARKLSASQKNLASEFAQLSAAAAENFTKGASSRPSTPTEAESTSPDELFSPFLKKPFCSYRGHNADVLDVCWSKSYFMLSSSMDKTVRLWHVSRNECLCVFQHIDFVTSIAFLQDDKFFISGSFDGKLRVWSITEKKVALWNELEGNRFITALAFVNNGKYVVAGTFDGKCVFYSTEQLKYHTMIDVKSSRGKNARPHKVTGLCVFPDRARGGDKLLVTSNDSRIRLYDLNNLSLQCKYKGLTNQDSQIAASFSPDGKHIICGSEDRYIYLWRTSVESLTLGVRKDRNRMWEKVRSHSSVVTATTFAPKPDLVMAQVEKAKARLTSLGQGAAEGTVPGTPVGIPSKTLPPPAGDVIVSADFSGNIAVFLNRTRPLKAGASTFFNAF